MRHASLFVLAAPMLVLLASCVAPAQPRPAPVAPSRPERPVPPPAVPPPAAAPAPASAQWHDRAAAPGNWTYRAEAAGSAAFFGPPAAEPRLVIRCDRASRRISLIRAGAGRGAMIVRTSYGAQSWPATAAATPLPQTVAVRAASDAALDQIAYSRGRFAVEVQGLEPLTLPVWAEIARVIEDCRG